MLLDAMPFRGPERKLVYVRDPDLDLIEISEPLPGSEGTVTLGA
jgi:hypothetical protein